MLARMILLLCNNEVALAILVLHAHLAQLHCTLHSYIAATGSVPGL